MFMSVNTSYHDSLYQGQHLKNQSNLSIQNITDHSRTELAAIVLFPPLIIFKGKNRHCFDFKCLKQCWIFFSLWYSISNYNQAFARGQKDLVNNFLDYKTGERTELSKLKVDILGQVLKKHITQLRSGKKKNQKTSLEILVLGVES